MDWLWGFGAGILAATLAYLVGRLQARMDHAGRVEIVAPGASQGPSRDEFDSLSGRVKKIALEWEDTHERLLRMARSARAAARHLSAAEEPEEPEPAPEPANGRQSRAAVLAAYRRANAPRQ